MMRFTILTRVIFQMTDPTKPRDHFITEPMIINLDHVVSLHPSDDIPSLGAVSRLVLHDEKTIIFVVGDLTNLVSHFNDLEQ